MDANEMTDLALAVSTVYPQFERVAAMSGRDWHLLTLECQGKTVVIEVQSRTATLACITAFAKHCRLAGNQEMELPMENTDYLLGYQDGQRTARINPYLDDVKNIAEHRLREASRVLQLNRRLYLRGFKRGYKDELSGLAHPLPDEGKELRNGN